MTCSPGGHKESDTAERLNNDCSTAQSPASRQTTPSLSCEHCFVPRINQDLDLDLDPVQAVQGAPAEGAVGGLHPGGLLRPRIHLSCLRGVSSFGPEVPESSCSPVLREHCPPAPGLADGGRGRGQGKGRRPAHCWCRDPATPTLQTPLGPQSLDDPWGGWVWPETRFANSLGSFWRLAG